MPIFKGILTLLCSLYINISLSQSIADPVTQDLIPEVQKLMGLFKISIRPNQHLDKPPVFFINKGYSPLQAKFMSYENGTAVPFRGEVQMFYLRYYVKPQIEISPLINRILFNKDTTKKMELIALSIVAHELVHYFSITMNPKNYTDTDVTRYYSQPIEIEGNSVCAYWFFERFNKPLLDEIMSLDISIECKKKLLINHYLEVVFPNTNSLTTLLCDPKETIYYR